MDLMDCGDDSDKPAVSGTPWPMKVCVRRRPVDDPFFDEGNILCNLQYKQTSLSHEEIDEFTSLVAEFTCQVTGCRCSEVFNTTTAYELHYNSVHRNVCSVCRRMFPTFHLLDIHLLESHDAVFAILATKQKMYQCLVENCHEKFLLPPERKDHLIRAHKYPSNFRFHKERKCTYSKHTANQPQTAEMATTDMDAESGSQKMEIECKQKKATPHVPKTICFGRGVQRTFQPKKGKKKSKGKHWHQANTDVNMDTAVNIEDVKMDGLAEALNT